MTGGAASGVGIFSQLPSWFLICWEGRELLASCCNEEKMVARRSALSGLITFYMKSPG